ncbi:hypothetical protein [Qipengyuania sp.]|uniref:hypothetical protein n=1 Tax=Qipengyuania sp. TaxID=2004515 RepID=UPI0035C86AB0
MEQTPPAHAPAPPPRSLCLGPGPKPTRCSADYRWTQPKIIAFLTVLSQCGLIAEAARSVGMSRQSAYRMMARFRGTQVAANFENARRIGIRARAEASRARLASGASRWEGPVLAELVARERTRAGLGPEPATKRTATGDSAAPQGDAAAMQGDTVAAQGDTAAPRGDTPTRQGDTSPRKETKLSLDRGPGGPCLENGHGTDRRTCG